MKFDPQHIRSDFPILGEKVYNKPLVYLDNAATTQKPIQVLNAMQEAYLKYNSNIHRGVHFLSQRATIAHENARETVRQFIGAQHAHEVIFTRGTTESINLIAWSFGERYCGKGDEIIISAMEHHSNIVPWQMLCERKGCNLKVIPFNEKGELEMDAFESLISSRTRLVAIAHISNSLGTINPVKEIIRKAHQQNIPVMVDAAQSVPHMPVNVQELDADFLVFSGHKMYAPTGIGVMYGKEQYLNEMPPYQGGGEMIESVSFEKTTYNALPFKFEAGTPDFTSSVGLAAAIDYMTAIGIGKIAAYEHELFAYAYKELSKIEGIKFIGDATNKSSVISFVFDGIHHFDLGTLLDQLGIAVRTGHHCAQPVMNAFGIEGTTRASFSFYNTFDEVDALVKGINKAVSMLS